MNLLDMRTLLFSYGVTSIVCAWFVLLLWRQSRDRFAGMTFLMIDFIFQAAALVLVILRGHIPDWISIVFSNTLVIAGAILGFIGQERFVDKKGLQIHNYLLVLVFMLVHSYFTFVQPNLAVRNLNISVALLLVCFQSVWLMWHRVELDLRSVTFDVGLVNFLYCMVSVVRIVQLFFGVHMEDNFLRAGLFDALVIASYQVLFIMLTYSLVLMVNKRLFLQVSTQEEKFAKAFHSAPYAITLTRLSDGTIIDVNETFDAMTGYHRAEVLGKKTTDLNIWENGEDRATVVETLSRTGKVNNRELPFRKKNGESLTGLFSAEIIQIDGEKNVLSSIGDITERKRAEDALKASEEQVRLLLNSTAEAIYGINMKGECTFANPSCLRMLGYTDMDQLLGKNMHDLTHHSYPDGSPMAVDVCGIYQAVRKGKGMHSDAEVLWKADGSSFPVEYWSYPQIVDCQVTGAVVTFLDITKRQHLEEELKQSEKQYRLLIETLPLAVVVHIEGKIIYVNPAFLLLFKASSSDKVIGMRLIEFVPPELFDTVERRRRIMTEERRALPPLELNVQCMDGTFMTVVSTPMPVIFQDEPAILEVLYDITERKRNEIELQKAQKLFQIHIREIEALQAKLKEQVLRDPLTGLFNRRYLEEALERELARASRAEFPIGIVMIDIDHFKQVNDTHGHRAGDLILQTLGKLLLDGIRAGDIACRYGGEEFLLVLPQASREVTAERSEQLRASFEAMETMCGEKTLQATISIGVAVYPTEGKTMEAVIQEADRAMYRAKALGRNRVVLS